MNKQFDPGAEYEKQLRKELEAIEFPNDKLKIEFNNSVIQALVEKSIKEFGCDLETYKKIVKASDKTVLDNWDLYSISFAINTLENSSPRELALNFDNQYIELITTTREMGEYWNSLVEPIKTKIQSSIKTKMALGAPKVGKFVNPNLRKR